MRSESLSKFFKNGWAQVKKFVLWLLTSIYGMLEVGAKVAGSLSVLVGVIYGAVEYNQTKEDKQVEKTFAYLKSFDEAPYVVSRDKIQLALEKNYQKIQVAVVDAKALETTINTIVIQEGIKNDVDRVIYFYDELVYCIISGLCQPQLAHDLFYPKANDFYVNLYSYIVSNRSNSAASHYGSGLEALISDKPAAK